MVERGEINLKFPMMAVNGRSKIKTELLHMNKMAENDNSNLPDNFENVVLTGYFDLLYWLFETYAQVKRGND